MREYIFRGKRVKDGAWVEGSLLTVQISDRCAYLIFGSEFRLDGEDVKSMSHAAVDPSTVRQFTGLRDRSGARIFEGDILKAAKRVSCIPTGKLGYAKWSDVMCSYEIRTAGGAYLLDAECGPSFDIVGNVFDDAALLRGDLND